MKAAKHPDDAIVRPRAGDGPLFEEPPSMPTYPRPFARTIPQTPAPECAVLQYASGLTKARTGDRGPFQPLIGFHAQIGRDPDLDVACANAQIPRGQIRHMGGVIADHWLFGESVQLYPITSGPPATTISACRSERFRAATASAGLGLAWPTGGKSRLALRGYLAVGEQLVTVQLAVTSTMTTYLLAALVDHVRVCVVADDLVKANGKRSAEVLPYEVALVLRSGDPVVVGTQQTQEITPLISDHPAQIERDYLAQHWRPAYLPAWVAQDWPAVQAWAAGYDSGETNGDSHLVKDEI